MSDIMERLAKLGVTKGMPQTPKAKPPRDDTMLQALKRSFPDAIIAENDYGPYFLNRLSLDLPFMQGQVDMSAELVPCPLFDSVMGMHIEKREDTLAMDTETSGLSNGSGSFVFMIGLSYYQGSQYIVDQLILPDFTYESAFLRQIELTFQRFPILLTYNGKSFDVPMIASRGNFHRFPDFCSEIKHIDLLYLARRYWKPRLGSVRLANIEQYVLELARGDEETPGYLAPELYRQFLAGSDASCLTGIAYHNQEDVISLSAYMLLLNRLCAESTEDLSAWSRAGASEQAVIRYHYSALPDAMKRETRGMNRKDKKGIAAKLAKEDPEAAIGLYEPLAAEGDLDACRKLIDIYTHLKQPEKATLYKEKARTLIEADETIGYWTKKSLLEKLGVRS